MVSRSTGYSKAATWSTVPAQSTLYLIYNDDWYLGERRDHVRMLGSPVSSKPGEFFLVLHAGMLTGQMS